MILDRVREELFADAAAQRDPGEWLQVCVRVESDVAQDAGEARVGRIRNLRGASDQVLDVVDRVAPREVADLELLRLAERLAVGPRRSSDPDRLLGHRQVEHRAARIFADRLHAG